MDVDDVALGHDTKMRWNKPSQWVWSEDPTHTAIISVETFAAAQEVFAGTQRAAVRRKRTKHTYVLSGLVHCAVCDRRMQGSWNNNKPYYRCKFPTEYGVTEKRHAKTVYVREDAIVPSLDTWIGGLFDDDHFDATAQALAAASKAAPDDDQTRDLELRLRLQECDTKLAKYRALLEHDSDITIAATWIAEIERERRGLERDLGRKPTPRKLTKNEIKALIVQLRNIVAVLVVNLTYHPDGRVHVAAGAPYVLGVRVGGATSTLSTRDP